MPKLMKRIGSIVLVAALLSGLLPQDVSPPQVEALAAYSYIDIAGHPAAAAIQRWTELGVATGIRTVDGYMFYPDKTATRAEFFTFFNHVLNDSVTTPVWQYADVSADKWYYRELTKAVAAGLIQGKTENMMRPDDPITRQEVVVLLAQSMGLYAPNASALGEYCSDSDSVGVFARGYVAAFFEKGWLEKNKDRPFEPYKLITRAEAMTMLDTWLRYVPSGSNFMSNASLTGNLLMRYPGVDIINMKIDGDVILGDGVGQGNFALRNCTVNGRLVIRGGGPNSVNLSGTKISGGIYVYNPNGATRIYNTNSTVRTGVVTARTTTFFEGEGIASVEVPDNAILGSYFTFTDTSLDSLMINKPLTRVTVNRGTIDNLLVQSGGESTSIALNGAGVNFLDIKAPNVTVTGNGTIDTAVIDAPGANLAMWPRLISIAPGLSVIIGGSVVKGPDLGDTDDARPNTVSRADAAMAVRRDTPQTGGSTLALATVAGSSYNQVNITQSAGTALQISELRRLAYWVGFFVPVPANYQNPVIKASYTFESPSSPSQPDAEYSLPVVRQDGVNGVIVYIPAKLDFLGVGAIDTIINFTWGDATYEKIRFKAEGLKVAPPTDAQSKTLAAQFANAVYRAYDGLHTYSGSEALRRLLDGDNALGLDLRGLSSYSAIDKQRFLAQMYVDRAQLTTKKAIQAYLTEKTNFVGALYAVNHAISAPEMRGILERSDYADQLNIDVTARSSYGGLSGIGKSAVANDMLLQRKTGYATEALVKAQFDKSVAARQTAEVALLALINNSVDATALLKIMDNKTYGPQLGIGGEPYTKAPADLKKKAAQKVIDKKPFRTLEEVIAILSPPEQYIPPKIDPDDDPAITAITSDPAALRLVIGKSGVLLPRVNAPSGYWSSPTSLKRVTIDVKNNPTTAKVVDAQVASGTGLVVTGLMKGSATLTLSVKDAKEKVYKTTVKVDVVDAVPTTNIELDQQTIDISKGQSRQIRAILTPAGATGEITWYADKQSDAGGNLIDIVTVSGVGSTCMITGVNAGFTNIVAEAENGMKALCKVFVGDEESKVLLEKYSATVGVDCYVDIVGRLSPVASSVRTLTYESENPAYVMIDNPLTGTVKGIKDTSDAYPDGVKITVRSAAYPNAVPAVFTVKVDPNKHGVYLSERGPITLYKNGYKDLYVEIAPKGSDTPVWNIIGSDKVLKVEPDKDDPTHARVTGLTAGKAQIVVSLQNDHEATAVCDFEVLNTELKVTVKPTEMTKTPLVVGDPVNGTRFLAVTFSPAPNNTKVDYRSLDETIAKVDQDGLVTAVKQGSTRVVVRPQANGQEILIDVKVTEIPLTEIAVQSEITLNLNETHTLPIRFFPDTASNKDLLWTSNDGGTVRVDSKTGFMTAIRTTMSSQTSIVRDPITGQPVYDIIVKPDGTTETSLNPREEMITVNKPVTITVNALGIADPKKAIKAILVTVLDRETTKVNEVKIVLEDWIINAGRTRQLSVVFNDNDPNNMPANRNVTWDSDNTAVATVNASGLVTAVAPGIAGITVHAEDGGKSHTVRVVVAPVGVTGVLFEGLSTSQSGQWMKMNMNDLSGINTRFKVTPEGTSDSRLNWSSSNESAVSVTDGGLLKAVSFGASEIKVSPYSDLTNGTATPRSVMEDPKDVAWPIISDGNPETLKLMAQSGIKKVATATSIQNEYVFLENGAYYTLKDPNGHDLLLDSPIPLVVRNPLVGAPASFTAVVFNTPPDGLVVRLDAPMTSGVYQIPVDVNTPITAAITPANSKLSSVVWTDDKGVVLKSETSGEHTSAYTVKPTAEGDIKLTCTVTMDAYTVPLAGTAKEWPNPEGKVTFTQTVTLRAVVTKPTAVEISRGDDNGDLYAKAGTTLQMNAKVTPATASDKTVKWTRNDAAIGDIDPVTGLITLNGAPGDLIITATCNGDTTVKAAMTIKIKPLISPTAITFAASGTSLSVGSLTSITAFLSFDAEGLAYQQYTRQDINWSVDRSGFISFDATDHDSVIEITGLSAGTVTLTATSGDGKVKGSCTITVTEPGTAAPPESVVGLALPIGLRYAQALPDLANIHNDEQIVSAVYRSDNPAVASVDANGVISANQNGEATLSVTYKGNTLRMRVSVDGKEAKKLKLRSSARVILGDKITLRPDITPFDATAYIWSSSDSSVASVSPAGEVVGLKTGRAAITLVSADGSLTSKCTVYVSDAPSVRVTKVRLNAKTRTLYKGDTFNLEAVVSPSNAPYSGVSWYSSNPAAVRVDPYGNVYALAGGRATITAVTDDGALTASMTITVKVRVEAIGLSASEMKLEVGDVKRLAATVTPADATTTTVTWKSSDSSVASVGADGRVVAKKEGEVTITARCDGKSATLKIQVSAKKAAEPSASSAK
ncbi:hypothetical protein FACS1894202_00180 [Clostridia bacterium]|nr:hypothetical protein FACS1894202_00180 [Clostridia bacterium]